MKRNKAFFIKFGVIICAVAVLIGIANFLYINGYYYRDVYGEVQKFQDVPEHITFANFGTSHGLAAFRYDENDKSSFNFALSGEDIYHDFQTLKQFSDNLDKGCIVTIPVSYFSFCLSTDEPSQKRYYTYLDRQYIRDFRLETLINSKYIPVLRSIEYLFKDLIGDQEINVENFMDDPVQNNQGLINAAFVLPKVSLAKTSTNATADSTVNKSDTSAEDLKVKMLDEHALTRAESWRSGRMVLGQKYMPDNTELLVEMIDYCKEHDFTPVLITIPVYHSLTEAFTDDELNKYYFSNIEKVVEKTNVINIDYSADNRFIFNPEFFTNSDHMSAVGGDAFTQSYKSDLKDNGIVVN